jgi:hypothetical protein
VPHTVPTVYDWGQVITPLDKVFPIMNDTVKIERPMCCRRHEDLGGRIKQDSVGNPITVRTRAHDSEDEVSSSWLIIAATV